jgi:hypothetical protein
MITPKPIIMHYTYQTQMTCYFMWYGAPTKSFGWLLCLVFLTLDTTPMMNIEDRPLMIMDGMCTNRKSSPYDRAFLPSECEWVFDFSMVVALPLLYGNNVIRNIQQVTTDGDRQIYNPLDILSKNESSPWYGVKHMLCTFHLVEQQFDNYVLKKEDR